MYEYLDRFTAQWSDDDLIGVLSQLPSHPIVGSDWSALISAIGVKNFMHLSMIMPGKEIKIPSLFEILCVVAAEGIMQKAKESSIPEAKKQVLGELELKEVDALVERLQATTEPSEISSDT